MAARGPAGEPEFSGSVEQDRGEALRRSHIAIESCDRTRSLSQCVTKRQRMPTRLGFVHGKPRSGGGLIRKSLEPQNPRQQSSRCYPLVDQKTDGRRLVNGTDGAGKSALEVLACIGLVSEIMKDNPGHAIGR